MNPAITNPSSVADIVGSSVRLARDNARSLIKILFWPSLVELVGKIITLIGINALIGAGQGNMGLMAGGILTCTIGGSLALVAEFFLTLRQLALVRLYAGIDDNFADCYEYVKKKKFQLLASVIGTYFLFIFCVFGCSLEIGVSMAAMTNKALVFIAFFAACIGIVMVFVAMLWSTVPLMIIAPAIAVENRPFSQLISRSLKFSFTNLMRATYFSLLLFVALFFLSSVLNLPPAIMSIVELGTNFLGSHPAAKAPNLLIQIFASIWRSGVNMVLSPMAFFAFGYFYFDLRMRAEGYDITRRLALINKRSY